MATILISEAEVGMTISEGFIVILDKSAAENGATVLTFARAEDGSVMGELTDNALGTGVVTVDDTINWEDI